MSIFLSLMLLAAIAQPLAAKSLPFNICAESTTWVRPSPEVQAKIWNMGRYKGMPGEPHEWTHDFIVIDDPLSASIAYDVSNLTGLWTEPPPENKCATDETNRRSGGDWIEVLALLHRVTRVTHENNTYTVTVDPAGRGFQAVYIRRMNPSAVLRFVTQDGKELERWDESAPPNRVKNELPPGTRIILPNGQKIISK